MKSRIVTDTMTRTERALIYKREALEVLNNINTVDLVKSAQSKAKRFKRKVGTVSLDRTFKHNIYVETNRRGEMQFTGHTLRLKTFEAYKLNNDNTYIFVYTQHFLDRINERLGLGLTSYRDIFKHYIVNERLETGFILTDPDDSSRAMYRTKHGFSYLTIDPKEPILYNNTWYETPEDKDNNIKAILRMQANATKEEIDNFYRVMQDYHLSNRR